MTSTQVDEVRRDALVERLFGARSGRSIFSASTWATGSGCTARSRTAADVGRRAGERGRSQRALRARVARAAGDARSSTRSTPTTASGASPARRARRGPARRGQPQPHGPVGQLLVACLRPIDAVLAAFRNGGGVPYADYGADLHEGQAAFTRPLFSPPREGLVALRARDPRAPPGDPPARVADLACGGGISSIAIARAYPKVIVDGIDLDRPRSRGRQQLCRQAVWRTGWRSMPGRRGSRALRPLRPRDDLRGAARHVVPGRRAPERALLSDGGRVLVGDEKTAARFAAGRRRPGAPLLRLQRPALPARRNGRRERRRNRHRHARRQSRLRREAGFAECEVAPIENDFWRFYLLRP